ncbi:hypothetical protein [Thermoanaerobacter uzonensis]|uniref:hypothetical protein n=1 Tax=Thermoanaerobacter uzonensis TaxID=447593 RepID=UPI003D767756
MEERTERVLKGLGDFIDGYEYHYPNEINENNVHNIKGILSSEGKDIYCIAFGAEF